MTRHMPITFTPVLSILLSLAFVTPAATAQRTIAGRVVNEKGEAVAGAYVCGIEDTFMTPFLSYSAAPTMAAEGTSDETGRFTLRLKRPLRNRYHCVFAARHPHYGIGWIMGFSLMREAESLDALRIVLPKRDSIQGKITDTQGNPVAGALVVPALSTSSEMSFFGLKGLGAHACLLSARTGEDGRFALDGLAEGSYAALRVSHPEFAIGTLGAADMWALGGVRVGDSGVEMKLEPGATIEGTVVFEEKQQPVSGAVIEAFLPVTEVESFMPLAIERRMVGTLRAETRTDGQYALSGLPPGAYGIQVKYPGYTAEAKQSVRLRKGQRLTGQDFTLTKGVVVRGRFVMAQTAEPVKDAFLDYRGSGVVRSFAFRARAEADENGNFEFRQPPGELFLYPAASSGYLPGGFDPFKKLDLTAAQDVAELVFEIRPWLVFKGEVLGPECEALGGAEVCEAQTRFMSAKTAEDGKFELTLVDKHPGEYERVMLEARHPSLQGYLGVLGRRLQSAADTRGTIKILPAAAIKGRVVAVTGQPIKEARLNAHLGNGAGWSGWVTAITDESGSYEIREIPEGATCRMEVWARGYGLGRSEEFSVKTGEHYRVPDLALQIADLSVEGTVKFEDGSAAPGAHVACESDVSWAPPTVSDENGHFRLNHLVDEEVVVRANLHTADAFYEGNAKVRPGAKQIEIVLAKKAVYQR